MISAGMILRKEDSSLTHGGREDCVLYMETIADVVEKLEKDHDQYWGDSQRTLCMTIEIPASNTFCCSTHNSHGINRNISLFVF